MAGVGDKQHLRALELELLDQMIEFRSEDALWRAGRGIRIEAGQDEHIVHAVWVGTLETFGLLRAAACDRQNTRSPAWLRASKSLNARITEARSAPASNSAADVSDAAAA